MSKQDVFDENGKATCTAQGKSPYTTSIGIAVYSLFGTINNEIEMLTQQSYMVAVGHFFRSCEGCYERRDYTDMITITHWQYVKKINFKGQTIIDDMGDVYFGGKLIHQDRDLYASYLNHDFTWENYTMSSKEFVIKSWSQEGFSYSAGNSSSVHVNGTLTVYFTE
ncbi:hypothetical protein [Campylobacter hyointestinalis]|uniref:hypothetical protein n=1 Tax=Campylobacter hyointestinalis TaxID=198 RepID=UPI0007287772|nr:hypothetical protein [Campylobacter hyointestinalis]CUU80390.1 Uncharacterised protein [Campylobacter hyointestinalis subsp. hyointestinalis]